MQVPKSDTQPPVLLFDSQQYWLDVHVVLGLVGQVHGPLPLPHAGMVHLPLGQVRPVQQSDAPSGQLEPLSAQETVIVQAGECVAVTGVLSLSVAETEIVAMPIADAAGVPLIEPPVCVRPAGSEPIV